MSEYILRRKLQGSNGAVNVLLFSEDGQLLLSGGDDDCVRIWNTENFQCEQILYSTEWGQITALTWIIDESSVARKSSSICIGTGRGSVALVPLSNENRWFIWKDAAISAPFDFNDAVEAQSYDPLHTRLAIASHSGQIKVFEVEDRTILKPMWTANISNAIPSALAFFGSTNQHLLIHGTETGEMCCRDALDSSMLWTKTLPGGIGNATLSPDETLLMVDNLSTGTFDIYPFPASVPSRSFTLKATRCFTKQCVFAEGAKIAICGSDRGRVHVVDIASGECLQSLRSDFDRDMFQAVTFTAASSSRCLIAGGSSGITTDIYLWEKNEILLPGNLDLPVAVPTLSVGYTWQTIVNVILVVAIMTVTYQNWSPLFWKFSLKISAHLSSAFGAMADFSARHGNL